MKNIISILFCLFMLSVATTWAQYPGFTVASVGTDVTRPGLQVVNRPVYHWVQSNHALVDLTANAVSIVMKYQGTGTLKAEIWVSLLEGQASDPQVGEVSTSAYKGSNQTGYVSDTDSYSARAAFLEGWVKAEANGSTEGSAYSKLTVTW